VNQVVGLSITMIQRNVPLTVRKKPPETIRLVNSWSC